MLSKIRIIHILLLAFLLRLIFFLIHQPWNPEVEKMQVISGDAVGYHYLAHCIFQHFSFCDNTFRTPGYPAFLAFFYVIFGVKPYLVLFVQILLNVFSVYILFSLCKRIWNEKVALIAAFLLSIDPHQILFCHFLFADTLYATLFLLTFYFFVKGLQEERTRFFIYSAIFLGLNLLTKPVIQFYPFALVLFLFIWTKFSFTFRLKNALIILLLSYVFVLPWMMRNYIRFNNFSICSISGNSMFFYNIPLAEAKATKIDKDSIINRNLRELAKQYPKAKYLPKESSQMWLNITFENNEMYSAFANEYVSTHKMRYFKAHCNGMVKLMINVGTQNFLEKLHIETKNKWNDNQRYTLSIFQQVILFFKTKSFVEIFLGIFIIILLSISYIGFFVGSVDMLISQKKILLWLLFAGSIFYFLMIYGVLPIVRFKLPITMLYLPISSLGLSIIVNRIKNYYIISKTKTSISK